MHHDKGMIKFLFNKGLMLEVLSNRKFLKRYVFYWAVPRARKKFRYLIKFMVR
jgi:hypothetical protein